MGHNALISPSESLYYKGNQFYEDKDYAAAIAQYKAFLEAKPTSELATPATLNLGMAHYYSEEYKPAYDVLKGLTIKDENIKKYVLGIVEICKANAKEEIEAEEQAQLAAASPDTTASGEIEITVLDAYVDNFGAVVLKGTANQKSTIIIDNKKIDTGDDNNTFHATASWKKGNPIVISAKGTGGNSGELNYFPDGETPLKPTGLRTLNITSNSIEIEWNKNEEEDVKGYRLFYREQGDALKEVPELIKKTKH
jgi:tetratricopeptide (TPR) repeat protein